MATRVVVDPVTRIEGHLRIEAVVENGVITDAFSAGTMVRGLEKILIGRDPRDAWAITERVCGVCTTVHALASVRSVEDALGIAVPPTAELIRNIMLTTQYVQDHVIHFYHLHALDWVDIVNALKADPKKAAELAQSFSKWDKNTPAYFTAVQDKIKAFAASGLGIFANGYWGHPAYKLPPEVNLIGVAHYLDALEWQKEIVKIHAVFGGKNPHPNYLVGGVPCSINVNEVAAINSERLNLVSRLISQADEFINEVYIPDLLAVASFYKDWAKYGGGLHNYLCYGEFPTKGYSHPEAFKYARGAVLNRDLSTVLSGESARLSRRSRSTLRTPGTATRAETTWACIRGRARPRSTTPDPSRRSRRLEGYDKYSFLKTPRWKDNAMEVGPLARLLVSYAAGHADVKETVGMVLGKLERAGRRAVQHAGPHRGARHRCGAGHDLAEGVLRRVDGPREDQRGVHVQRREVGAEDLAGGCEGVGLVEAPRGALAHWIKIHNGAIDNYQLVVPTTWNGSPRDAKQQRSSFEASLIGTPVAKLEQPVEIIRTIHSFDPCLACAVHLYDPQGRHLHQVSFE